MKVNQWFKVVVDDNVNLHSKIKYSPYIKERDNMESEVTKGILLGTILGIFVGFMITFIVMFDEGIDTQNKQELITEACEHIYENEPLEVYTQYCK